MAHTSWHAVAADDALINAALGLAPNMEAIAKGYYDRQGLSQPEREDYNMLRGQGVPDAEARALAYALNGRGRGSVINHLKKASPDKKPLSMQQRESFAMWREMGLSAPEARRMALSGKLPVGKALSDPYLKAFHASAKKVLPDWLHEQLHTHARSSAGGTGAKVSRMARSDETKAEQLADIAFIKEFLKTLEDEVVTKGTLTRSDVHVEVPIGLAPNKAKKKPPIAKANDTLVQAAASAAPNADATTNEAVPAPLDAIAYLQANKLVAGMDAEMLSGAGDPDVARDRASRMMLERPGYYDSVADEPELRSLGGLDVDLGSGNSRSMGFLGVDLYPYDYGTILHDLEFGIPFPDGCVRSLHVRNVLEQMYGPDGDPTPLLMEAQRVLMEGGRLLYEGAQPLMAEGATMPTPGLELSSSTPRQIPGQPVRQIFIRVPIPVPAYHGAVAPFQATELSGLSVDEQLSLRAHNEAPAEVAMANLVHKKDIHIPGDLGDHAPPPLTRAVIQKGIGANKVASIFKSDDWRQIVYGVVLAPNELDSQNDWMTPADIEEAAHHYLATSRVVGTEHTDPIAAVPVESFIAPQDLDFNGRYGPTRVTEGSWVLGVKINSPDEWEKVLSGDYTGFSVGGFGIRE